MHTYAWYSSLWKSAKLTHTLLFFIRTSNFAAEAEPKINVFFFHILSLKRSQHVLKLRLIEFQKAGINVTKKG